MSIGHFLVIRPGALGDSVLTLPAISALYRASTGSVTMLGTPASFAFLRSDNSAVEIRDFASSGWLGLFADVPVSVIPTRILRRTHTAVVYLSDESKTIARRLANFGIKRTLFIDPPKATPFDPSHLGASATCTQVKWRDLSANHAARQMLDPLAELVSEPILREALDPTIFEPLAWLHPSDDELETAKRFLGIAESDDRRFVALHPGSGGRKKCWPAANYAQLATHFARDLHAEPLVFFGPADDATRAEFESAMPPGVPWRPVALRPLREVLALLHFCCGLAGNDSGMAHFAARVCPVLALFGPTEPAIWAPVGRNVWVVTAPRGDLQALDVDFVLNQLNRIAVSPERAA